MYIIYTYCYYLFLSFFKFLFKKKGCPRFKVFFYDFKKDLKIINFKKIAS